jgi:adenine deaminase
VNDHGFALERILPFVTSNTACALKLHQKGNVAVGKVADLLVMRKEGLELVEVISRGRRLIKSGSVNVTEKFLKDSNRFIKLEGQKNGNSQNGVPHFGSDGRARERESEKAMCKAK